MSIERIFHCDGPECEVHIRTVASRPATGFFTLTEQWPGRRVTHHLCSWDCVMKFAAAKEPLELIGLADD
jgi:hypothetical protein